MKLKIYIAKCPMTVTDTMYFSNKEEQDAYFSNLERLEIDASYNGARDFKVYKNYLSLINSGYNYMYFEYENRWWYTFIDEIYYVNDSVCGLKVSTDFIQTFMFDVQWSKSRICNRTYKKADFIGKNIAYDNKFPVSNEITTLIGNLSGKDVYIGETVVGKLGFLVITVNGSAQPLSTIKFAGTEQVIKKFTTYEGKDYPIVMFYIPICLTQSGISKWDFYISEYDTDTDRYKMNNLMIDDFISELSPYIVNCSIISTEINYDTGKYSGRTLIYPTRSTGKIIEWSNGDNKFYCYTIGNNVGVSAEEVSKNIEYNTNDIMLLQKYFSIFLGTRLENNEIMFNDFKLSDGVQAITISYSQQLIPPFKSIYRIKINNNEMLDKIKIFSLNNNIFSSPYEVTAWAEYYINNMSSVNDGLQTKHKYEEEISKINFTTKGVTSGVGLLSGIGLMFNPATIASGAGLGLASATSLANAATTYKTEELNRQKESALLQISWGDIKSSPSILNNLNSDLFCYISELNEDEYIGTGAAIIGVVIPANLDDIREFHKIYGFATHRVEDYNHETLKKHTVFDYISFDDPVLTANLPKDTIAILKEIYRNGVRFWYSKDTFLNYNIENEEV